MERTGNLLNFKEVSRLVNLTIASSNIKSIKIPHQFIRPNMHLVIYGLVGTGKSTILNEIIEKLGLGSSVISLTKATLLGSVDKTSGGFIPPVVWDARNNVLPIDELYIPKEGIVRDVIRTLVSVMETPRYSKRVGYRCNDFKEKDGDLFCKVEGNKISISTRFSVIATTMMTLNLNAKLENVDVNAFVSRCIVVPFYPSMDELIGMAKGKKLYHFKDLRTSKKPKDVIITKSVYNKVLKFIEENFKEIGKSDYLRTIGDLCRVYAVNGKINVSDFFLVIKSKGGKVE